MTAQPWQKIAMPFGILAIIFLILTYRADGQDNQKIWAGFALFNLIVLSVMYVMNPQINWWFWQQQPPRLAMQIEQLIDSDFTYYKNLSPELKQRFRTRLTLYMRGNAFIRPVRLDETGADKLRTLVPEELKAMVAAVSTQVFFGKMDFMTGKYENIVLYQHPFPSPQYDTFHTSELHHEDGVMLFDANTLMAGFERPHQFFSIGLYEMTLVFKNLYPSVFTPILDLETMQTLEKMSGMSQEAIVGVIGLTNIDDFGIAAHHFFTFSEAFKTVLPDLYQLFVNIFQQNPVDKLTPILKY